MLKIGLTGGIGSGKSTVADLFNSYFNIPVIDADIIAHQLVEPGQPTLIEIQQTFGKSILHKDGSLNRNKLRDIIFSDANSKKQLEALLHPLIYEQMQIQFNQQTSAYSILCIPLLIETNMTDFVDRTLVIDCPIDTQIKRVTQRDRLTPARILSIINSQISRESRLSCADDIIDNSNLNTQLAEQVKKLHNQYLILSNHVNSK